MKFVSWNVNGLRACMTKGFQEFFEECDADFFAIQETKMQESQLDDSMRFSNYYMYMNSAERKGYSGTLVYAKKEPISVQYEIEGDTTKEGRVITLEYDQFYFVCAYVPNAKEKLLRLSWRVEWEQLLRNHLNQLNEKKPVIYCGDLNVAHNEIDLKNPSANHQNAGFSDDERNEFSKLLACGFTDTYRYLYPAKEEYSWWSYRFKARERNAGWRIDYFVVSDSLQQKVIDSRIDTQVFGSDHCPIELEINI